jgi:hypothetical protein
LGGLVACVANASREWHHVEEHARNMAVEHFGDPIDGRQAYGIRRGAVQPNHNVLDHDLTSVACLSAASEAMKR